MPNPRYIDLELANDGRTCIIRLNRPAQRNAWSVEMAGELNDALTPSLAGYVIAIAVGIAFPTVAVVLFLVMAIFIALPLGTFRAAVRQV